MIHGKQYEKKMHYFIKRTKLSGTRTEVAEKLKNFEVCHNFLREFSYIENLRNQKAKDF